MATMNVNSRVIQPPVVQYFDFQAPKNKFQLNLIETVKIWWPSEFSPSLQEKKICVILPDGSKVETTAKSLQHKLSEKVAQLYSSYRPIFSLL